MSSNCVDRFILFVAVVNLIVLIPARAAVAQDIRASAAAPCTVQNPALFESVEMPATLEPVILKLLDRSPTFRQQCRRIVDAHHLRLVVRLIFPTGSFPVRATVRRSPVGRFQGWIDLTTVPTRYAEWIGHEFEHIIEHLDGVDIRERARRRDGAYEVTAGLFETRRASEAGSRIAQEFKTGAPVAVVAARGSR